MEGAIRTYPQSYNPSPVTASVDSFLVGQMEDACKAASHVGWHEHEINLPLCWQDRDGGQEVVLGQDQLLRP